MDDSIPFGRFFLLGQVGQSQMIEVWIAGEVRPAGERRTCVIKRIGPAYQEFTALRKVLEAEARLAKSLDHPGLVAFLDAGEIDGLPYVATELVDGIAMRQLGVLFTAPALPVAPLLDIGRRVADALSYGHQTTGSIHGRLSPSNILLGRKAEVKIADFGMALAGDPGARPDAIPTPEQVRYLSPEQIRHQTVDARADLFALGVLMTEMATGHILLPTGATNVADVAALVRERCAAPPREALPKSLVSLLASLVADSPDDRPDSAAAVVEALAAISLAHASGPTMPEWLDAEVFVKLPYIGDLLAPPAGAATTAPTDPAKAMLAPAHVPGDRLEQMSTGESYPTTGTVLLNDVVEEPPDEPIFDNADELPTLQQQIARLPSSAMIPIVDPLVVDDLRLRPSAAQLLAGDLGEPAPIVPVAPPQVVRGEVVRGEVERAEGSIPPLPSAARYPGTYKLAGGGLKLIMSYDPYLRSIGIAPGGVAEAGDPKEWEYYFTDGDRVGPRLIRKGLSARIYRDQTVTLLEGSRLFSERLDEMLLGSREIPAGSVSARGGTDSFQLDDEQAADRYLRVHERRQPRPRARRPDTSLKDKFFRFLGRDG